MADTRTVDPFVVIEEQRLGYVRYRALDTGRRWEVHGKCDRRGDCLIGAVIDGEQIKDRDTLALKTASLGRTRIDSELDVPVTPEFTGCCPFTYVVLDPGKPDPVGPLPFVEAL